MTTQIIHRLQIYCYCECKISLSSSILLTVNANCRCKRLATGATTRHRKITKSRTRTTNWLLVSPIKLISTFFCELWNRKVFHHWEHREIGFCTSNTKKMRCVYYYPFLFIFPPIFSNLILLHFGFGRDLVSSQSRSSRKIEIESARIIRNSFSSNVFPSASLIRYNFNFFVHFSIPPLDFVITPNS